jgi:methylmalonyl-CoA/ethylmalonyl-CoA epimerase
MTEATIDGVDLDHVAHAVPRWQDVWPRYAVELGAEWSSGGPGRGFAPGQLRFGNGARIEILMPHDIESNDFLARFLDKHGSGPHHITFKVPDLELAIDTSRRAGYQPIGIDLTDPEWMEAFIHPKQATGVVVQLAQAPHAWTSPPPDDFPTERRQRRDGGGPVPPASLHRVVHAVADLGEGTALFVDLLGGKIVNQGTAPGQHWIDLTWGGPLGVRLLAPDEAAPPRSAAASPGTAGSPAGNSLRAWLGGRNGRVHHLELTAAEPEQLSGARQMTEFPAGTDRVGAPFPFEISPEDNAGMGLVVRAE